jgi:hypothetical protein
MARAALQDYLEAMGQAGDDSASPTPKAPLPEPTPPEPGDNPPINPGTMPTAILMIKGDE